MRNASRDPAYAQRGANDLEAIYKTLYKTARAKHPELPAWQVLMQVTSRARSSPRSFAFFQFPETKGPRNPQHCHVELSPDLIDDRARALAVVAHELGHLIDWKVDRDTLARRLAHVERPDGTGTVAMAGMPLSPERRADLIGETLLGQPIWYSEPSLGWVQTIRQDANAVRPRPSWLG